jgi:3'(2'), 5'-bisphosphate nucleotidase
MPGKEKSWLEENGNARKLKTAPADGSLTVVQSRSHAGEKEQEFYSKFDIADTVSIGSSLKFCLVAEGRAHLYYRSGPTMEWDTAAGQAVLESAGGTVTLENSERFRYNKENLLNPGFICACDKGLVG